MRWLAVVVLLLPGLARAQEVPEPDGYRMEDYRAPVPETLRGAQVVDADAAYALWQSGGVAFVDVLPQPPKPANLPEGTVWRAKPRESIPGAVWLPNTGYGALAEADAQYFRDGLAAVTGGATAHPLLIFCLADCWMSWNAAKRAVAEGYAKVYWLPTGTDGWAAAGHPLERVTPRR